MSETREQSTPQDAGNQASAPHGPGRADRWVKLALLLAAAAVGVWMWHSTRQPTLKGMPLSEALQQAQAEQRRVVVVFMNATLGGDDRHNEGVISKSGNDQALRQGNFLLAIERTSLDSELARTYALTQLPTMLIVTPQGEEINRFEGRVGEVEFRSHFLQGSRGGQ